MFLMLNIRHINNINNINNISYISRRPHSFLQPTEKIAIFAG